VVFEPRLTATKNCNILAGLLATVSNSAQLPSYIYPLLILTVKIFSFIFTDLFVMGVKLCLIYSGKNTG
jgi:hypothetical protein